MVHGTGPTACNKKSANAATNGSKPVCTQKKKTAPTSKTPTPPPTKNCVRKSVLEKLDAALQPPTSGKIVIPKCTITCMDSDEQLEIEFMSISYWHVCRLQLSLCHIIFTQVYTLDVILESKRQPRKFFFLREKARNP